MCVWAIIPVKPLKNAKSRLAGVLSPDQRYEFAQAMLRHVLEVATSLPGIAGTLVVSRDTKVLAIAREAGAKTVQESGAPELNTALTRATEVVRTWGCETILILPADLPLITGEDIINMVDLGTDAPSVVIATDRDADGTNALLIQPPGVIPFAFGPGSFQRHIDLAHEAGIEAKVYHSTCLSLDIDLPIDLERFNRLVKQNEQHRFLPILESDNIAEDS
jgi:2-phospho-L-lactate guanylyltransferase